MTGLPIAFFDDWKQGLEFGEQVPGSRPGILFGGFISSNLCCPVSPSIVLLLTSLVTGRSISIRVQILVNRLQGPYFVDFLEVTNI